MSNIVEYSYDAVGNRLTKTLDGITVNYNNPYGTSGNRLSSWSATSTNNYELLRTISVAGHSSETIGTNDMFGMLWVSNSVAVTPDVDGTNFSINSFVVDSGIQQIVAAIRDVAGNVGYATNTITTRIVTNAAYSYSDAGCLTNITYSGLSYPETTTSLKWDSKYQLNLVKTNGAVAEYYGYDVLGRRKWISDGSITNWLVYDGNQVVAETDSSGNLTKSYTWGTGIDNLLSFTTYGSETNTYYAITDHLGTVHALTDSSGNIVESYKYDAWGRILKIKDGSDNTLTESAVGNRYLWQGREYSYTTSLYYFRARYYDPITGRWLSKDPIGISGGLNQYVFCANSPVNYRDMFGLEAYYVNNDGRHAAIIVADPSSSTGYTEYSFVPSDGGWGDGLPIMKKIKEMMDGLHCTGEMRKFDTYPSKDAYKIDTTCNEDSKIRDAGDSLVSSPGSYDVAFRNCSTVALDILYSAGFVPPATKLWIYTPNSVYSIVEKRNKARARHKSLKKILWL